MNDEAPRRPSAIGRPLDPRYATNRAVLALMAVGAVAFGVLAVLDGGVGWPALGAAGVGAGVVLGTWALAREVAPDDQRAAFVAMGMGLAAAVLTDGWSLLLLFVAMLLARVVNRTVGPRATWLDSVAVLGLAAWCARSLGRPEVWGAAALAYGVDAWRSEDRGRHAVIAAVCAVAMLVQAPLVRATGSLEVAGLAAGRVAAPGPLGSTGVLGSGDPLGWGPVLVWAAALVTSVAFGAMIVRTRSVVSVADVTGERLDASRVRGGMVVTVALALASLRPERPLADGALVWATLVGVATSFWVARRGRIPT